MEESLDCAGESEYIDRVLSSVCDTLSVTNPSICVPYIEINHAGDHVVVATIAFLLSTPERT